MNGNGRGGALEKMTNAAPLPAEPAALERWLEPWQGVAALVIAVGFGFFAWRLWEDVLKSGPLEEED